MDSTQSSLWLAANVIAEIAIVLLSGASPAKADITSNIMASPHGGLEEALATRDRYSLYDGKTMDGFNVAGGFFSGRASGVIPAGSNYLDDAAGGNLKLDRTVELEVDQRVYALLVDGRYDFNYDERNSLPLHPYISGGAGMAVYGTGGVPSASALAMQSGAMMPLFRVGGGVTYRLGEQWDLSLDYKAGFSGIVGDQLFTGRSQQPVDLHVLNMGMHYRF
jgi:hypothetical protein